LNILLTTADIQAVFSKIEKDLFEIRRAVEKMEAMIFEMILERGADKHQSVSVARASPATE